MYGIKDARKLAGLRCETRESAGWFSGCVASDRGLGRAGRKVCEMPVLYHRGYLDRRILNRVAHDERHQHGGMHASQTFEGMDIRGKDL